MEVPDSCRLCLVDIPKDVYTAKNIFNWPMKGQTYSESLQDLMHIPLKMSPTLPSNACCACLLSISKLLEFKAQIISSQEELARGITQIIIPMDDKLLDENLGLRPVIKEEPTDDSVDEQPTTSASQVDCEPSQPTLETDPEPENDNETLTDSDETSDAEMCETVTNSAEQDDEKTDSPASEADNLKKGTRNEKFIEDHGNNEENIRIEETNSSVAYKRLNTKKYWTSTIKPSKNLENIMKSLRMLECQKCDNASPHDTYDDMCAHMMDVHKTKRQNVHLRCCKRVIRSCSVYEHARYHEDKHAFPCEDCGKFFLSDYLRKRHYESSHGDHQFKCSTCKSSFTTEGKLNLHLLKHAAVATQICEICGKSCRDSQLLSVHKKQVHQQLTAKHCDECGKYFLNLKHHKSRAHRKDFKKGCPDCGKLMNRKYLEMHIRTVHQGEKKYPCTICEKSFVTKAKRDMHIGTHRGLRYPCDFCSVTYACRTPILRHMEKVHAVEWAELKRSREKERLAKYKLVKQSKEVIAEEGAEDQSKMSE